MPTVSKHIFLFKNWSLTEFCFVNFFEFLRWNSKILWNFEIFKCMKYLNFCTKNLDFESKLQISKLKNIRIRKNLGANFSSKKKISIFNQKLMFEKFAYFRLILAWKENFWHLSLFEKTHQIKFLDKKCILTHCSVMNKIMHHHHTFSWWKTINFEIWNDF